MLLLGQTEAHLDAETGSRAGIGIRYQWFIDCALKVALHGELLVYNVTDIGPQLEVYVSIGDRTEVIHFSLDGLIVTDGDVHPEGYIVLQDDRSTLRFERQLHVIFRKTNFARNILAVEFRHLGV